MKWGRLLLSSAVLSPASEGGRGKESAHNGISAVGVYQELRFELVSHINAAGSEKKVMSAVIMSELHGAC